MTATTQDTTQPGITLDDLDEQIKFCEGSAILSSSRQTASKFEAILASLIRLREIEGKLRDSGELWSWLKKAMEQGAAIHQDYAAGNHKSYEEYSARMDLAASERADQLALLLRGKL